MLQTKTKKILFDEIAEQLDTHPDICIRSYYKALSSLDLNGDSRLINVISASFLKRPNYTSKLFVNLIYRATQYIMLYEYRHSSFHEFGEKEWIDLLKKLENDNDLLIKFEELITKETTQTTIFQRYLAPKVLISMFFNNYEISVLDLGCGLNIGLPGIEQNEEFNIVEDNTTDNLITKYMNDKVHIKKGVAVDIGDPKDKKDWAMACGFYPQEMYMFAQVAEFTKNLWGRTNVKFKKANVYNVSQYLEENEKFDVIIASTMFYQHENLDDVEILLQKLSQNHLTQNGIIIINDFMVVSESKFRWGSSWFDKKGEGYKYLTGVMVKGVAYEAFKWGNGRCNKVVDGKDIKTITKIAKDSKSNFK